MVTPQLGYHHSSGNHGNHHQVPSNQKGRLLPLQPVHGAPSIAVISSSLSTLHETSESSSNGSFTNTPDTLTEKVPKVTNSENDKFSDDSLEGGGVAAVDRLHAPHPHNVVVNHAFREGSQTLSPIWQLGRQLPNDEDLYWTPNSTTSSSATTITNKVCCYGNCCATK